MSWFKDKKINDCYESDKVNGSWCEQIRSRPRKKCQSCRKSKLNIKKVSIFTPYSKKLNDDVLDYFKSEGFEVTSNSYFDIQDDYDIGKVDQDYLYDVRSKIDLNGADALFVSCTALPVLEIIDKLEKKLNTIVLSSNQALIWDTLVKIKKNNSVEGFGKLFQVN